MLTDKERAALREEELYRRAVRDEFAAKPPSWRAALTSIDMLKWVIATLALPLAVWIYSHYQDRQHAASLRTDREIAEGRKDVDQLTALLPALSNPDNRQRAIALAVLAGLVRVKSASPTVRDLYNQINAQTVEDQKSDDTQTAAAAAATREVLIRNSVATSLAPSAPTEAVAATAKQIPVVKTPPPSAVINGQTFVYTQIYREQQRAEADRLSEALRGQGVPVLGVQNVLTRATASQLAYAQRGSIDIRFYHPEDKAAALSLVPIIKSSSPEYGEPTVHDLSQRRSVGKPGTLEIWYPCAPRTAACNSQGGQL